MKRVLSPRNAAEAHIAAATLESAGIEAAIHGEHMGAFPAGPATTPSVWVRDEDYAAACKLLGVEPDTTPPATAGRSPAWIILAVIVALLLLMLARA
jgi:hypothetical protein